MTFHHSRFTKTIFTLAITRIAQEYRNQCFGIDVFWSNWQFQLLCESQIPNPIPITFQILLNYNLKVISANELKFFGKFLT